MNCDSRQSPQSGCSNVMRLNVSDADTEDLSVQTAPKHFSRSSVHLSSAGSDYRLTCRFPKACQVGLWVEDDRPWNLASAISRLPCGTLTEQHFGRFRCIQTRLNKGIPHPAYSRSRPANYLEPVGVCGTNGSHQFRSSI